MPRDSAAFLASPACSAFWASPSLLASCLNLLELLGLLLELFHLAIELLLGQAAILAGFLELFLPLFEVGEVRELLGHLAELFLQSFLLGLAHLAGRQLLLKLLELVGGLLEVALGEVFHELIGRPLAAHFLELLELPLDLFGRAELLLAILEGVSQRIELDHHLVFARRRGLGEVFALLFDLGQDLFGLGELLLVDRLALAGDFLGEEIGLLGERLGVGQGRGPRLGDAGNQRPGQREAARRRRPGSAPPRRAAGIRRPNSAATSRSVTLRMASASRASPAGVVPQVLGKRERGAHPLVQVKDAVERDGRVQPAGAGKERERRRRSEADTRRRRQTAPSAAPASID